MGIKTVVAAAAVAFTAMLPLHAHADQTRGEGSDRNDTTEIDACPHGDHSLSRTDGHCGVVPAAKDKCPEGDWIPSDTDGRCGTPTKVMPTSGRVTQWYGMRVHPITKKAEFHNGTDFGAACGSASRSPLKGIVIESGWKNNGYGWRVVVRHTDGVHTTHNHLQQRGAKVGTIVKRGEVVGLVGNTGMSTGCHLHFEVYSNDVLFDSYKWLTGKTSGVNNGVAPGSSKWRQDKRTWKILR